MEIEIEQMIGLTLTKEELLLLEKEEKQLKIICEELNEILANHEKATIKTKQRLKLKDDAERVVSPIQSKKTNQLLSSDMARLIKAIEKDQLFKNKKTVKKNNTRTPKHKKTHWKA